MDRVYRLLLGLLPASFRREYGEEMRRVVEEHWVEIRGRAGPWAALRFWARQGWAVLRAAVTLRLGRGGVGRGGVGAAWPAARQGVDSGRGGWMDGMGTDLRHAGRSLLKRPLLSGVTIATLGLGVGAATAIFSAVHAVLLRELPYEDPERIVAVFHENRETGERGTGLSPANARDLAERAELLEAAAVAEPYSRDLQVEGRAESLRTWWVSAGFFEAVGVEASLGRSFAPEEYAPGGEAVVMLGHRSWTDRFGADPGVVGRTLTLDGRPHTVVGVLPPGFRLPDEAELWQPRPPQEYDEPSRAAEYMMGFARLTPGATLEQAAAEADRIAASIAAAHPETSADLAFRLVPLREHLFGDVRAPLLVLFGAVGVVLLIACANVAGLMLARGAERQREYALRGALGASAGRLVRHVVAESALLATAGCALGIALAYGGVQAIQALGPDHLPRIDELRVDGAVLAFAVVAAAGSALLSALAPSIRLARPDLRESLAQGGRGTTGGRRAFALRNRLVVAEIAAAVVLLMGAGLLTRSFAVLLDEELGYDPTNRLAVQVFAYDYESVEERNQFANAALDGMRALPGVERVALTSTLPGANDGSLASLDVELPFVVEDRAAPPEGQEPRAFAVIVSPDYFEVLDIPVVSGRGFLRSDDTSSQRVAVVNETLARTHFGGEDPLGERITVGAAGRRTTWEIVGVVADVRAAGHASSPRPEIYRSLGQAGTGSLTFVLEASRDPAVLTAPAMEAVWQANPAQSVWGAATLESLLSDWLVERRFNLMLLGGLAVVALLLAAVGIYGLVSYSVEQRASELGIRRALGGASRDILGLVLMEGSRLAAAGVVLGVAGALLVTRYLEGMLYGVEPTDPATFGLLSLAVLATAVLAALGPALRAVRVDPMESLREE